MTAPEPLTADEVRALREVAVGATPGPWVTEVYCSGMSVDADGQHVAPIIADKNAKHIAAFDPPTVLRLLAVAEQHAAMVARAGALADEWEANGENPHTDDDMDIGWAAMTLRAALGTAEAER